MKGFALIVAIIVVVIFTTLAVFGTSMLTNDVYIGYEAYKSKQALYLAESGVEYALRQLSRDWANATSVNISMDGGYFSLEYSNKTQTATNLTAIGVDSNSIRKIFVHIRKKSPFEYAIYCGGSIDTQNAQNLTITGAQVENATNLPTVDLSYYEGIANYTFYSDVTFASGNYSGVWYIDGNVKIESNVVINGSIISTNKISLNGKSNILIDSELPYPALVSNGNFDFKNAQNITVQGAIYVGADMTGNFDIKNTENINFSGSIIVAGKLDLKNSESVTITYDPGVGENPPPGFTFESERVVITNWREIP